LFKRRRNIPRWRKRNPVNIHLKSVNWSWDMWSLFFLNYQPVRESYLFFTRKGHINYLQSNIRKILQFLANGKQLMFGTLTRRIECKSTQSYSRASHIKSLSL
jgi:hypothetical protein